MRICLKMLEDASLAAGPCLDASSHLYNRVCPSVTLLSRTGKSMTLIVNNDHIMIQSFHHHKDASLALWALFLSCFILLNTLSAEATATATVIVSGIRNAKEMMGKTDYKLGVVILLSRSNGPMVF